VEDLTSVACPTTAGGFYVPNTADRSNVVVLSMIFIFYYSLTTNLILEKSNY